MSGFPMKYDRQASNNDTSDVRLCFCIGPQNGEPLCPCRMRNVRIINGRYIEQIDHGPTPNQKADTESPETPAER